MQNKQKNARETHRPALSSPSEVLTMLKGLKKVTQEQRAKAVLNMKHPVKPQSHTEEEQHQDHRQRTVSSINYRGWFNALFLSTNFKRFVVNVVSDIQSC